ncbi:MAG: O-antigen ligase family protein, partial [Kiritimatiellae bacterium]|nr:O-antigen ligase family protein [Kiritimatiellia bacterium]
MTEWSSRTSRSDAAFAVFAPLILLLSIVPLASVGYFETAALSAVLVLLGLFFLLPDVFRTAAPPTRPAWFARVCVFCLALWCAAQLVPVLPDWNIPLALRWRGPADLYSRVAAHFPFPLPVALFPHATLHTLLLWLGLAFFAAAASRRLFHHRPRLLFLSLFVAVATLEALWGIVARDPGSFRVHGHFANSDAFGGLLAMSIPVTLGLLLSHSLAQAPRGERTVAHFLAGRSSLAAPLFLTAALLVQWGALFFSGSRGAALAALVATALLLVPAAIGRPRLRRALLVAIPFVAVLGALFWFNALRQNVADRAAASPDIAAAVIPRASIWQAACRFVADLPAGAGPGGMEQFLAHYQDPAVHGRVALDFAHNDVLQFLGDLGLPGSALLLFLLLFLAVRAVRACRAPAASPASSRVSQSPWVLRGTVAALVAALIQAQVEFNLSARPPLQLLFLALAGIVVSAGRPKPDRSAAPPRILFPSVVLLVATALLVAAASLSSAAAYRLARSAASAADAPPLPTDSPLFLPAPVDPDDALPALDLAARLDPLSPFVPLTRAHFLLQSQSADLRRAAAALSPDNPDSPALLARLALVYRPEEIRVVTDARAAAEDAIARAPWAPRPLALRAWTILRGAAIGAFPDSDAALALDDLRLAVDLFPAESVVLENVAQAFLLAADRSPEDLERLFNIGNRIISLNPALTDSVIELWWSAGASIDRIFAIPHLPTRCLWNLYRLAESSDLSLRTAVLDRIEASLDDPVLFPPVPDTASPFAIPLPAHATPEARARHVIRLASERFRLAAIAGDLPAIAASAPTRASARSDKGGADFAKATDPLFSRPIQMAHLRRLFEARTLPAKYQVLAAVALAADTPRDPLVLATLRDAKRFGRLGQAHLDALAALPDPPKYSSPDDLPVVPAPVPESSLDIPYLGETVVLDSLALYTNPCAVSATFRFRSSDLPPALSVSFTLRDPEGRRIASRSALFESNWPSYNRGNPDVSVPCTLTLPLPETARLADTLQFAVSRAPSAPVYSDDLRAPLVFATAPLFVQNPDAPPPPPRKPRAPRHPKTPPPSEPTPSEPESA